MGFFKSILSEIVGEDTLDNINPFARKESDESGKQGQSANPLETPPPPPIPTPKESMSVMVAVNGQTYGPYERATLLEMIDNGSLTEQTYVFIEGMGSWNYAKDVPQVAALFTAGKAPAVPPVPWSNPTAAPGPKTSTDNSLSPRLNQLITAAVADGEISDLERQVLIRNAQQEGVAMDEFVMILEARLFEQRQALKSQQEEKERREKAVQAQMAQAAARPAQAQSRPKLQKCPHCGAPYQELSTRCPECGQDYPSTLAGETAKSAWEKLSDMLYEIDCNPNIKEDNVMAESFGRTNSKSFVKAKVIANFPVPISKTDLFEFMTNCLPLAKKKSMWGQDSQGAKEMGQAYYDKCVQAMLKARVVLKDDKGMLEQLEMLVKQYKIKV